MPSIMDGVMSLSVSPGVPARAVTRRHIDTYLVWFPFDVADDKTIFQSSSPIPRPRAPPRPRESKTKTNWVTHTYTHAHTRDCHLSAGQPGPHTPTFAFCPERRLTGARPKSFRSSKTCWAQGAVVTHASSWRRTTVSGVGVTLATDGVVPNPLGNIRTAIALGGARLIYLETCWCASSPLRSKLWRRLLTHSPGENIKGSTVSFFVAALLLGTDKKKRQVDRQTQGVAFSWHGGPCSSGCLVNPSSLATGERSYFHPPQPILRNSSCPGMNSKESCLLRCIYVRAW